MKASQKADPCEPTPREKMIRSYKKEEKRLREIATQFNMALQELIAEGHTDVSKYLLFDSKCQMRDIRENLGSPGNASDAQRKLMCLGLAMMNIGHDESLIVYNDFFFPRQKKWWTDYFSRSVYYRIRKKAVLSLIKVMKIWDED